MRAMVLWGVKLLGMVVSLLAHLAQHVEVDAGHAAARAFVGKADAGPSAVEPIGAVRPVGLAGEELLLEIGAELRLKTLDLLGCEEPFLDQSVGIDLDHAGMLGDALIHQRLGEGRLVRLVMAVPPVAEHVDDDRLAETLAELGGDLGDVDHGFRIVAVHVEDRCVDHLGDVGRVGR